MTLRIGRTDNSGFSARSGKSLPIGTSNCFAGQCRAVEYRPADCSGVVLVPAHQEGAGKQRQLNVSPGGFSTFSRLIPDVTPESLKQMLSKRAVGNSSAIAEGVRSARFECARFRCAPVAVQTSGLGFSLSELREDSPDRHTGVTVCCPQGTKQCF